MKYKTKGLNKLSKQLHDFQIEAGFTDANVVQRLMLVHSEISEAFEAFRKDKYANLEEFESMFFVDEIHFKMAFEGFIKDTIEDELADSVIRLLAICGENNINIERHIKLKMKYNELRGYKYGGKKF